MNRNFKNSTLLLFAMLVVVVISCKDDDNDFTNVTALEQALHKEVNNYRTSVGLSELVLQFSMVKEAQLHSTDWGNGTLGDNPSTGIDDRFQTVIDKLGGTTTGVILQSWSGQTDALSIVNSWINIPSLDSVLVGEYTQSGPGTYTDTDGNLYVTHMFLNIPSPK